MTADCAFFQGRTHRVCQDYAIARSEEDGSAFVLLADGCSSSPDTDIGARLLVQAARGPLARLPLCAGDEAIRAFHQEAVQRAADCAGWLGLAPTCLDATLLTIRASKDRFAVTCYGDGAVALGRADGGIVVYSVRFTGGYPGYASYLLDPARRAQFLEAEGNEKEITHYRGLPGDDAPHVRESDRTVETFHGGAEEYDWVAALSDGIHSFSEVTSTATSRATRPVPMDEALPALLAFKSLRGEFVQRRAQAFLRECRTRGWHHNDDLAIGAVAFLGV